MENLCLGDILLNSAKCRPGKTAVISYNNDVQYTYGELNAAVNRLVNALSNAGVRKGDRIAIAQHNCIEYIETFFAASKLGAILVPLDHRVVARELVHMLNDSESSIFLFGSGLLDIVRSVCHELATVKNFIVIGEASDFAYSYREFCLSCSVKEPVIDINDSDLATIHYTSGTTGRPKGVMMTHKNLVASTMIMLASLPITSEDITLHTSPFSHIAAEWPLLAHCYAGGTNVVMEKPEVEIILEAIQKNQVTTWNAVPTLIQRVLEYPSLKQCDLKSLKWITYGASPIPVEVLKRAIRDIGEVFIQVYGLTETYVLTLLPKEDHVVSGSPSEVRRLGSCGKPITGCKVRVVNESGHDVAPGEIGEIVALGDAITQGYWRLPKETTDMTKSGWFQTGDLASVDEEGYIYIVDRKKEIIISGGENVSPKEVEGVIYGHPSVLEAAVIGVPDEKWVEAVKAILVIRDGHTVSDKDIITFCKQNLAGFKVPKSVEFIDSLPKTTSGKIAKKVLKDRYQG